MRTLDLLWYIYYLDNCIDGEAFCRLPKQYIKVIVAPIRFVMLKLIR